LEFIGDNADDEVSGAGTVLQLRLVVTAPDYDEALHVYRDVLGLNLALRMDPRGRRLLHLPPSPG
jgi:hypothetical protein